MANIMMVKEKLRQLRQSADWDASMVGLMDFWEKQIAWAEDNDERFYRLPKVVELSNLLESRLAFIEQELKTNRELTTPQRQALFIEKDLTEIEAAIFQYSDFIEGIEKSIDFEAEIFKKDAIGNGDDLVL